MEIEAIILYCSIDELFLKKCVENLIAKLGLNPWFYIYRGTPFVHHFTGVRTCAQKVLKFSNWSHLPDRADWIEIISNETMDVTKLKITNKLGTFKFKIVEDIFNLVMPFENACKVSSL